MAASLSLFRAPDARPAHRSESTVSEPQLFYDPPYATDEEDALAWELVRALKPSCGLRYRVVSANELLDFVIEAGVHRVGILIADDSRDDAIEAGSAGVDLVYRFRRSDIRDRLKDCLYLLALLDPALFDSRARVRLRRASSENLAIEFNGDRFSRITLRYEPVDPLIERDGEWLVLDPESLALETNVVRVDNRQLRVAV